MRWPVLISGVCGSTTSALPPVNPKYFSLKRPPSCGPVRQSVLLIILRISLRIHRIEKSTTALCRSVLAFGITNDFDIIFFMPALFSMRTTYGSESAFHFSFSMSARYARTHLVAVAGRYPGYFVSIILSP